MGTSSWVSPGSSLPSGATTRLAATIVLAGLIEAILILGFVVASLGIGHESHSEAGPDRPPLTMPGPAPAPDPPRIAA